MCQAPSQKHSRCLTDHPFPLSRWTACTAGRNWYNGPIFSSSGLCWKDVVQSFGATALRTSVQGEVSGSQGLCC